MTARERIAALYAPVTVVVRARPPQTLPPLVPAFGPPPDAPYANAGR
jgi:hypothetical protein